MTPVIALGLPFFLITIVTGYAVARWSDRLWTHVVTAVPLSLIACALTLLVTRGAFDAWSSYLVLGLTVALMSLVLSGLGGAMHWVVLIHPAEAED